MGETVKDRKEQPTRQIRKRIGNTTYEVNIRFNPQSGESMADKMKRVIINQINSSTKQ